MYDKNLISPDVLGWLMNNAQNELSAYLCEVDFREMYGTKWPLMAREQASLCRSVAAAATEPEDAGPWLDLARQYEETTACQ
jgi:hypothetical protein